MERLKLSVDADPGAVFDVPRDRLLALARLPPGRPGSAIRYLRRFALDLREALRGRPDIEEDPAVTVRQKYDTQAPFYAGQSGGEMSPALLEWFVKWAPAGGRVFVAGSGTGRESFALASAGWHVTGVDFSQPMVTAARAEAERRGIAAEFLLDDLRTCRRPDGSLAAVFFTYDVYSFVPGRIIRIELLRKMARWLRPDGVVFLSARRFERAYDPMILTLQRLVRPDRRRGGWGESHTRWIAPDATMHRSFVQVFTNRAIRREVEEAGFLMREWHGNHCLLAPRRGLP